MNKILFVKGLLENLDSGKSVKEYADVLLELIEKYFGFKKIILKLMLNNLDGLFVVSSRGVSDRLVSLSATPKWLGAGDRVVFGGEAEIIENVMEDERTAILSDVFIEEGIYSLLSIPIMKKHEAIGVINIYDNSSDAFTEEVIEDLMFVSGFASYLLDSLCEMETLIENVNRLERNNINLRKEISFHKSILESIPIGVIATDIKGYVILMNRVLEEMSLLKRKECLGKRWYEVFGFDGEIRKKLETSFRTSSPHLFPMVNLPLKDGSVLPVEMKTDIIKDKAGELIGVVAICTDIEEKRKIEQEIEKIERLSVIGKLSASVAHEIRNPLAGISGVIQIIKEKLKGDPEMERIVNRLFEEIGRLDGVVEKLNGIAFNKKMSFGLYSLTEVIDDSLFFILKLLHDKNIVLNRKLDESLPPVFMDKDAVYQVIINIIINAINAMPGGGKLSIETKLIEDLSVFGKEVVWYNSMSSCHIPPEQSKGLNPYAGIIIGDNGVGMSQNILPKIFDAFFKTSKNGTGLGLYICAKLVEQHQGMIGVKSKKGEGTTFYVLLPIRRGS